MPNCLFELTIELVMYFMYLPLFFFISPINAGNDVAINVCNQAVQPPPPQPGVGGVGGMAGVGGVGGVPGGAAAAIQRPIVDPNLCYDLDIEGCSAVFALHTPDQTIQGQHNP